jgi:hypothetical protein
MRPDKGYQLNLCLSKGALDPNHLNASNPFLFDSGNTLSPNRRIPRDARRIHYDILNSWRGAFDTSIS